MPSPLQKGLMEVLYEIFRLPVPIVTQDFTEALLSVGEKHFCLFIVHFHTSTECHLIYTSGVFYVA